MLIKLTETHYVAADAIAEVKVYEYSTQVTVIMKDGNKYFCNPNYKESVYAALDRFIAAINAALTSPVSITV